MVGLKKKIYSIVKYVPRGRVTTYAVVAGIAGRPLAVRAVGNALNKNRSRNIPCHRVVRSDGLVGGYARGEKVKIKLLRKEGVKIRGVRVDPSAILRAL